MADRLHYRIVQIPLYWGCINIKHVSNSVFSERYNHVPTVVIGPLRFTWRRYPEGL